MSKELQVLVLAHVVLHALVHGTCIVGTEVLHRQCQCLFVALHERAAGGIRDTGYAGRHHVVDRHTVVVLLDVDGSYGEVRIGAACHIAGIEGVLVGAPVAMHKVEGAEAQYNLVGEVGHEHAHEAYVGEVRDAAYALAVGILQGDAYEIPVYVLYLAVAQSHGGGTCVGDILAARAQVLGSDGQVVLPVFLAFAQSVVRVDVLNIRSVLPRRFVGLGRVLAVGRVALGHVDALVSVEHRHLVAVVVRTTEVVVVVVGRVGKQLLAHGIWQVCQGAAVQFVPEVHVCTVGLFLLVVQTVQAQVLLHARTAFVVEGVCYAVGLGHIAPCGLLHIVHVSVYGQSALVCLLAVLEDVLAYLAEVEIQVAAQFLLRGPVAFLVEERVHQPEFDVLDVLCLEVGIVHLAHHAAPALFGGEQVALCIHLGGEVVGTALLWIERHVQYAQRGVAVVGRLRLVGIQFQFVDGTDVVVGQLVQVALDVAGGERGTSVGEDGVHAVPCQQGTVIAVCHVVA